MNKEKIISFFKKIYYAKWINILFPLSSIVLLILMGLLMKQATSDGEPIIFSEWLIIMSTFFIMFILPYNGIRWLVWGKKKYAKKIIKKYKLMQNNTTTFQRTYAYDKMERINSCTKKLSQMYGIDPLFVEAGKFIIEKNKASIGMLQRWYKIGFNRAAKIMDQLAEACVVGEEQGAKPREILLSLEEFETALENVNSFDFSPEITDTFSTPVNSFVNYDSMTGPQFESFCSFLLISNGFKHVEVTKTSGDHGIDILAEKDGITYAIQCKCYSNNVGNDAVQQALAGKQFYKRDIAVVLTNQYFTPQAKEEASVFGVKLWDRNKLDELVQNINN